MEKWNDKIIIDYHMIECRKKKIEETTRRVVFF